MSQKKVKQQRRENRRFRLFWGSSYDRGLDQLLNMWPIIKQKFPEAELHIFYGWDLFVAGYKDNPERLAWKDRIDKQMQQPGIAHHGRVSKTELAKWRKYCGIWAYPTDFGETCCITALECQKDGCVPVAISKAALKETVGSGILVEGDIYDKETQVKFLQELLKLMGDEELWKQEQLKGQEFAQQFSWDKIAQRWAKEFDGNQT